MKADLSDNTDSPWQKTPVANLVRNIQSGNYYARIRVRGKLIWKSLKTDRISIAKLRLSDFQKGERQRAAAHKAVVRRKLLFRDALQIYRERLGTGAGEPASRRANVSRWVRRTASAPRCFLSQIPGICLPHERFR